MDTSGIVASLRATPAKLRSATADASPAQLTTPPKTGEWSITEVLRHLIAGDRDTFLPRLRRMLAESRPVFDSARGGPPPEGDAAALLKSFATVREEVVRTLSSLDAAGWQREGVSSSRGALTVEAYARSMAEHDVEHLGQIQDIRAVLGLPRQPVDGAAGQAGPASQAGTNPGWPSDTVQRVQAALDAIGRGHRIVELEQPARTAAMAAAALGCRVEQIANSLVFRGRQTGRAILVIASGGRRVVESAVAAVVEEPVHKADAAFVRSATGFAIGGVAPVGHTGPVTIVVDEELGRYAEIWAAGGHPNTVFKLTFEELTAMTGGRMAAVR